VRRSKDLVQQCLVVWCALQIHQSLFDSGEKLVDLSQEQGLVVGREVEAQRLRAAHARPRIIGAREIELERGVPADRGATGCRGFGSAAAGVARTPEWRTGPGDRRSAASDR